MTATDRELGGLVRDWLRPGTTTLSDGVFTRAMAEISTTPQRRGILPLRRWPALARTSRFALLGSTAILIVAVAGIGLLLMRPGPSVGPTVATPPTSPTPSAQSSRVPDQTQSAIDLGDGLRVTFEIPTGWSRYGVASVGTDDPKAPAGAEVSFYEADVVFKDPCNLDFFITQIAGPTSADLVDAFEKTGNYTISRSRDVQLGGYPGKGIDLTAPRDVDACPSRGFMMFADGQRVASASSNQRDSLWILDVADLRLVVDAVSFPGTPTDALVAQQRLVDSIRIERFGANPQPTATSVRRGTIDALAGLAIFFDIPQGWSKTGETAFGRSVDRYPPQPPTGVEVSFWEVDQVRQHPCTLSGLETGSATGTTPADLAAAFGRASEYEKTAQVDASLDGHPGKSLRITLPDQLGDCELPGRALLWASSAQPERYGLPGERDTLWILDVEGTRLMIDATSFPLTSAADLAAQQQLIDSIRIERVDTPTNPAPTVIDSIDGLRITYDLPAGWDAYDVGAHRLGSASNDIDVSFGIVDRVWQYPCRMPYLSNKSTTGTTPGDLAAKLRSAEGYTATEPIDIVLAGYPGQRLQLQMPASLGGCYDLRTELFLWIGQPMGYGSPGQQHDLWILDVEGTRLVVDATSFPHSSAEDLTAQQQLIDSIRIERVDTAASPSPSPSPSQAPEDGRGTWEAIDGLQITFDLPPGWSQPGGTGSTDRYPTPHVQGRNPGVAVNFYDEIDRAMPRPPAGPGLGPQDPGCRLPLGSNDDAGKTPADLAAKLQSDPHIAATRPVDVTLAGFKGKRLELQIPDPVSDCFLSAGLPLWIGRPTGFAVAGQRDTVWILDVRGKRVLIEAVSFPGTSAEDIAAQQRLIESIRITPTTP